MKSLLLFPLSFLLVSCATGPRYAPTTSETTWIYPHKVANPLTWLAMKEMHVFVLAVDQLPPSRSLEVDTGRHTFELEGQGPAHSYVYGKLEFVAEKDAYYYLHCRKVGKGRYEFVCETDYDDGDEETDAVRRVASSPASSEQYGRRPGGPVR